MNKEEFPRSKTAFIQLSTGEIKVADAPASAVQGFLGGRGLNMYYLYKYLKKGCDPLSPDNPFIIGTGLLTGTGAPNSGRLNITAKSPESGILGDSNVGGFFGPELRYAGIDRLVILGKSAKSSYLLIEDGKIEIRSADSLWGLNVSQVQHRLRKMLGKDIEILTIGKAGENMVRFACVMSRLKDAAGRCGLGAVMGSKNLKAIVARGRQGLAVKYPKELIKKTIELSKYLLKSKVVKVLGRVGTPFLYEVSNYLGAIRTNNSQLNAFEDSLNAEVIHQYVDKMTSCFGCLIHCRHRNSLGGEGPEYTTIGLLGANLGISDTTRVIELNNLANELGLDVSSTGTIIAWAIELYQRGIIDKELTGYDLRFGDFELIKSLMKDISHRRGFGNILSESTRAVSIFGEKSRDYLIAVKNLPQSDPHDCRYIKSFALGIATASRGADHLRSRPTLDILDLPPELMEKLYGAPIDPSPISYKTKEYIVYGQDNIHAVIDSLGLCKFICQGFNSPHLLGYEHFAELIHLVTGLKYSIEELKQVGIRIIDIERLINLNEGITRKDDTLPKRYFEDKMPLRIAKGHRIERDKFEQMLSRYYALRGWDEEGRLPAQREKELKELL